MNNLARFDKNGIELVIDLNTGESFATISGYARMARKTPQAISSRLRVAKSEDVKEAQIQTEGGIQGHKLISGKLARKWLIKDNPELAEEMIEVGWTVYCHQLAGFKVTSTTTKPPLVKNPEPLQLEQSVEFAERIVALKGEIPESLRQILLDQFGDRLLTQKQSPSSEPRLIGVAQLAEEMGLPVNDSNRSLLGKFVKKLGLNSTTEARYCNGQLRKINVYEHTKELENAVNLYFNK